MQRTNFDLNQNAIDDMNNNGLIKMALQNQETTIATGFDHKRGITFYFTDYTGTLRDPYLMLSVTLVAEPTELKLLGSQMNILSGRVTIK